MSHTILKPHCFITLEEAADWLKIPLDAVGIEGDTKASLIVQDLTYTSVLFGVDGNAIQIEYVGGATAGAEVVTVTDKKISVQIEPGVSRADQIKPKVEANANAAALVSVVVSGTGSAVQAVASLANLASGAFAEDYDARTTRSLIRIINSSCSKIESLIRTPVLWKEFIETHDGTSSNVVKPHHWPVRIITELRIDYNRAFGSTSVIPPAQYFTRGGSDMRIKSGSPELQIGDSLVLRDDNETFILGRIFSGSVVGSIKLTYKAGWGETAEEVPDDLSQAALLLTEYWYLQRENRDINLSSKGVKGESYSKIKDGIPTQVLEMITEFEDVSLGTSEVPQRNYYRL